MDWQIDARSQLTVGGVAPSRHTGDCRVPGGCDVTCVVMGTIGRTHAERQAPMRQLEEADPQPAIESSGLALAIRQPPSAG